MPVTNATATPTVKITRKKPFGLLVMLGCLTGLGVAGYALDKKQKPARESAEEILARARREMEREQEQARRDEASRREKEPSRAAANEAA